jgi:hypothetical protein
MPFPNPMTFITALARGFKKSLITLTLAPLTVTIAQAAIVQPPPALHTATLAWNPASGSVQNYRLFVGTESQQYTQFYDSGTSPTVSVSDLEYGKTYYFAVRAIGASGLESELSDEVVVTVTPATLPVGTTMAATSSGSRVLNWSYPSAGLGSNPDFIVQASSDMVTWNEVGAISATSVSSVDGETATFSYPINTTAPRMFYRLTARNFVGEASVY